MNGREVKGPAVIGRPALAALLGLGVLLVAGVPPEAEAAHIGQQARGQSEREEVEREDVPVRTAAPAPGDTLTLGEAIETALGEAPDVTSARAGLSAAETGRWADWGAFLPNASASVSFSRSDFTTFTFVSPEGVSRRLEEPLESTSKGVSQGLSFGWTILDGGRRIAGLKAGARQVDAAAHRLDLTERTTVASVKRAYVEARKQERLAELAREQLEARRQDLEVTRERYRMAAVGRSDLLGAELEVEEARLALLEARDAARTARRELRLRMGLEPTSGSEEAGPALAGVPDPPDASALDPAALVRRALEENPELAALQAEAAAASANLWGARAQYLPTISVGFGLNRSESLGPEGDLFVFDPRNRGRSFSIQASWELFSGFQRREATAQASASLTQARAERTRRQLQLEKEVRDAVAGIRRRAERLEILRRRADLARQRLELAREQYRLGTFDYLQLQNATRQLSTAEEQLLRERYDYMAAWADLEERVGGVR